jgi:Tfp pilus assembly protein FimV
MRFLLCSIRPVRPDTPRLLPAIAACWPQLLDALRDPRTPVVERALPLLSEAVQLAGAHFMSGRFRTQAFPLLLQLLRKGTAATSSGKDASTARSLTGAEERWQQQRDLAPAAVQRIRIAALECLSSATSVKKTKNESNGGGGLPGLAWEVASAALPFLGRTQTQT